MNPSITSGQKKQYERFVSDTAEKALREASLDKNGLQRVFERGDKLQSVIMSTLKEISAPNFSLLHTFRLKVPAAYDHFTQLKSFRKKHCGEFEGFSPNMTDNNFARVTDRLVPGKNYIGKLFTSVKNQKLSHRKDCLPFLKSQGALLCGAQGLSLAWERAGKEFPAGHYWHSLDKKHSLCKREYDDGIGYMIPFISIAQHGYKFFDLVPFRDQSYEQIDLFCLCEP